MKRLTVHLKRVKKTTEIKEGRSRSKIHNTLSFKVKDESEAINIVNNIKDNYHPKNSRMAINKLMSLNLAISENIIFRIPFLVGSPIS